MTLGNEHVVPRETSQLRLRARTRKLKGVSLLTGFPKPLTIKARCVPGARLSSLGPASVAPNANWSFAAPHGTSAPVDANIS